MLELLYLYYFRFRWALSWWFTPGINMQWWMRPGNVRELFLQGHTQPQTYWNRKTWVTLTTQAPERLYFVDCDMTRMFQPETPQVYTKFIAIQGYEHRPYKLVMVKWDDFPFLEEIHLMASLIDLNELKNLKYLKRVYLGDPSKYKIPDFLKDKIHVRGWTNYSDKNEKDGSVKRD